MRSPQSNRRYFSAVPSFLIAPGLKISLGTVGQKHPPCGFEVGASLVEGFRDAAGTFAGP
jgi:hypothetical protein